MIRTFSIQVDPMGAPRTTRADAWKRRPVIERYHTFKDAIRAQLPAGFELPGELTLTFYVPMPTSWSRTKRAKMLGAPHSSKPDVDNLSKAFMDVFPEDAHVWSLVAEKYWAEEGSIEVEIWEEEAAV